MFFHQLDNNINIDNKIRLTVEQFKKLEPTYPNLPIGYNERYYEPNVTHYVNGPNRILINESLQWTDGDRYFDRYEEFLRLQNALNEEEMQIQKAVEIELNKRRPYYELRRKEYPSIEQMVVAMWDNLIEKQTKEISGIKAIQKLRKQIREKYPKPEN